jgi:DNA-binding NtrC family response regulator
MGAMDYLTKPFKTDALKTLILNAQEILQQKVEPDSEKESTECVKDIDYIVGNSPVMQELIATIRRVAASDSTVLITGESGTGKELVARAIHENSPRSSKPFIPVDCSALVENLLESELFGHVKGAFTGAHETKHGLFELANHGTFFFDEICNLNMNIQAKLLRVIQEREFMRVGSQQRIKLDIRIIAASNRDIQKAVKEGTFREDLYYRFNVVPTEVLPLRKRTEDILLLVEHFIEKYNGKCNRRIQGISDEALKSLTLYSWPGNIRELEHLIERILVLEDCDVIGLHNLPHYITKKEGNFQIFSNGGISLEDVEKHYIQFVLRRTKGVRHQAANILGINRKTLSQKIKKYGLRVNS